MTEAKCICTNCKWWFELDTGSAFGECLLAEMRPDGEQVYPQSKAHAWVNIHKVQEEATLITRYDFGCIQFELTKALTDSATEAGPQPVEEPSP